MTITPIQIPRYPSNIVTILVDTPFSQYTLHTHHCIWLNTVRHSYIVVLIREHALKVMEEEMAKLANITEAKVDKYVYKYSFIF